MSNHNRVVGIISFQGGVEEHILSFQNLGVKVKSVRTINDLQNITHLVIPGGESSVIGRFLESSGLTQEIKTKYNKGKLAIWGTCAGAVLLGKSTSAYTLNIMHIEVDRNAYGSQLYSFSAPLTTTINGCKSIQGVFIRAPKIKSVGKDVQVLSSYKKSPVLCREGRILTSTFHPELTESTCIQKYFTAKL